MVGSIDIGSPFPHVEPCTAQRVNLPSIGPQQLIERRRGVRQRSESLSVADLKSASGAAA
jgi:hypothetical protein